MSPIITNALGRANAKRNHPQRLRENHLRLRPAKGHRRETERAKALQALVTSSTALGQGHFPDRLQQALEVAGIADGIESVEMIGQDNKPDDAPY
jgi:hypothetical protein